MLVKTILNSSTSLDSTSRLEPTDRPEPQTGAGMDGTRPPEFGRILIPGKKAEGTRTFPREEAPGKVCGTATVRQRPVSPASQRHTAGWVGRLGAVFNFIYFDCRHFWNIKRKYVSRGLFGDGTAVGTGHSAHSGQQRASRTR